MKRHLPLVVPKLNLRDRIISNHLVLIGQYASNVGPIGLLTTHSEKIKEAGQGQINPIKKIIIGIGGDNNFMCQNPIG